MAATESQALSRFRELARVMADNFLANSALEEAPRSQLIVVLGSSASDIPSLPSWTEGLKEKIIDEVGGIFRNDEIFLREICRAISGEFGYYLWADDAKEAMREAILKRARVEQISNAACQMLGHADSTVRELISREYKALADTAQGPPPHLTYELLAHLTMHGFVNHIVTMNFDEMLDTALANELGPRGFRKIITGHEPLEAGERGVPTLFKVHGTASSPESLRFTHTEVSVLTSAQAKHLKFLVESARLAGCECLDLVSFGYSWQDPDLAHWVLAHLDRFCRIFIVRQRDEVPKFFIRNGESPPQLMVIPMNELCGKRALPSSLFWWFLVEEVWRLLEGGPLIPFSRHLLLGTLLAPDGGSLARRLRLEIMLQLLKSKGMINTFGAPDSRRIRSYFARLRTVERDVETEEDFLRFIGLRESLRRSREPEARATFFSTAGSLERLVEDATNTLLLKAPRFIKRPVLENGRLTVREVETIEFIRGQAREIAAAPEIEISREASVNLQSIFSHPVPLLSFAQFSAAVQRVLSSPWTHLLAIVESKRWLAYRWSRDFFNQSGDRKVLMILPSSEGLAEWRVGADLQRRERAIGIKEKTLELQIPWWRHNQHLFLPLRVEDSGVEMGPGVFFLREHKSPVVAPVLLTKSRDQAKLLATFLVYAQRSTEQGADLKEELARISERLLASGAIDRSMVGLVKNAYERLLGTESRPRGETRKPLKKPGKKRQGPKVKKPKEGAS